MERLRTVSEKARFPKQRAVNGIAHCTVLLPIAEFRKASNRAEPQCVRKQQKMSGLRAMPLHKGNVWDSSACSGMLNGFFGEAKDRSISHWRALKHGDEFNEEGEEEGETIIRRRERFNDELTLAFENGLVLELKETTDGVVDECME